jgi:sialate O-acetylesterase
VFPLGAEGATDDLSGHVGVELVARSTDPFALVTDQPSIRDWDHYASPEQPASDGWRRVRVRFDELRQDGWGVPQPHSPDELLALFLRVAPPRPLPGSPGGLFNAMVAPLTRFPLRGVIWYQGEGNAGRARQYRPLLQALIRGWRRAWKDDELAFLTVQLPGFGPVRDVPSDSNWAELRESQLASLQLPHTGLAVTLDLGDERDVHPRNKREVGERLALAALGVAYERPIVYSGPVPLESVREGEAMRVRFSHVGGGLVARGGGPVRGFALAGEDRRFHWADARIEGDTVVVRCDAVSEPVAVRYAWADSPAANLANRNGLLATPFRTDDWDPREDD